MTIVSSIFDKIKAFIFAIIRISNPQTSYDIISFYLFVYWDFMVIVSNTLTFIKKYLGFPIHTLLYDEYLI